MDSSSSSSSSREVKDHRHRRQPQFSDRALPMALSNNRTIRAGDGPARTAAWQDKNTARRHLTRRCPPVSLSVLYPIPSFPRSQLTITLTTHMTDLRRSSRRFRYLKENLRFEAVLNLSTSRIRTFTAQTSSNRRLLRFLGHRVSHRRQACNSMASHLSGVGLLLATEAVVATFEEVAAATTSNRTTALKRRCPHPLDLHLVLSVLGVETSQDDHLDSDRGLFSEGVAGVEARWTMGP